MEELTGGITIRTEKRELIYTNNRAKRVLPGLNYEKRHANLVSKEIWIICQTLIWSRSLFSNQHWLIETNILNQNATALHISAKWITLESLVNPYILITVEDRYQAIKNIAVEQAKKYRLTPCEKDVWLLHQDNYTYKQIASELCITPNTVKKHMRSIYAKQRGVETQTED